MGEYQDYNDDVQIIKEAILRSQYETGRVANANQLALYYGIGSYVSAISRTGKWGTGALASISEQLQKELPGFRGFSERNLKYMRTFFEEWCGQLEEGPSISALAGAETQVIAIRHLQVPNLDDEAQSAFLSIGFTHHRCSCQVKSRPREPVHKYFAWDTQRLSSRVSCALLE